MNTLDKSEAPKTTALFNLPLAPDSLPLIIQKNTRGIPSETPNFHPFQGIIYQPIEASGRFWARHWFGSKSGGSTDTNCARPLRTTNSELYPTTQQYPPNTDIGENVNRDTGTQADTPSQIIESSVLVGARVEGGAGWADYSSGGQTPFTRYVPVADATNTVTYTITDVHRIHLRMFMNDTNGKLAIYITESGVEIDDSQYLVGPQAGTRYVNPQYYISDFSDVRFGNAPLATRLDPTKTYVVLITWTTGLGARIYDSGLLGYKTTTNERDGYQYDLVGVYGVWGMYSTYPNFEGSYFAGSRAVYVTASCTRIDWRYATRPGGCFAGVKIFDSTGTEIPTGNYRNLTVHANGDRYIDLYQATPTLYSATLADELPFDVYYVHIWALPDRSAPFTETVNSIVSTQWGVYDGGLLTYDTSIGGTPGVDPFIDTIYQYIGGNSDPQDTAGNFGIALQVRDPGDPLHHLQPEASYVTGVHGAETDPENLVVTIDGVIVDWAGAANLTEWSCDVFKIDFTTRAGTQEHPTDYWADVTYQYIFTRAGIQCAISFVTTRQINHGTWYFGMCIAPNQHPTNGVGLGSGFTRMFIDPWLEKDIDDGAADILYNKTHNAIAFYSPEGYCIAMRQFQMGNIWEHWGGTSESGTEAIRRATTTKTYAMVFNDSNGGVGFPIAAGLTFSAHYQMRLFFDSAIPTLLSN